MMRRLDGMRYGLEGRIRLGVAKNVGRVWAGGGRPGLGVHGTGVEGTGVGWKREDMLFLEVLKKTVEVGKVLPAAGKVRALEGAEMVSRGTRAENDTGMTHERVIEI